MGEGNTRQKTRAKAKKPAKHTRLITILHLYVLPMALLFKASSMLFFFTKPESRTARMASFLYTLLQTMCVNVAVHYAFQSSWGFFASMPLLVVNYILFVDDDNYRLYMAKLPGQLRSPVVVVFIIVAAIASVAVVYKALQL